MHSLSLLSSELSNCCTRFSRKALVGGADLVVVEIPTWVPAASLSLSRIVKELVKVVK